MQIVVAAGFAALSLGDMIMVNSRKKKDWLREQEENYQKALTLARQAEANGTLTESLRMFLVKERALEEAEKEKKERGTLWSRTKQRVFGGLSKEDVPGGRLGAGLEAGTGSVVPVPPPQSLAEDGERQSVTRAGRTQELGRETVVAYDEPREIKAADEIRGQLVRASAPASARIGLRGGPLDQLADNVVSDIAASSRTWFGFGSGRS